MHVTVAFELSLDEVRRGVVRIARKRRQMTLWVWVPIMVISGVVSMASGQVGFGIFCVTLGAVYLLQLLVAPRRFAAKNAYRMCVPMEYTFAETGYTVRSALSSGENRWEGLVKAEDTGEFLLLYVSARMAHIVPKRAFTPDDAAQVSSFLKKAPLAAAQR